jgi:hypothetical protein
MERRNFLTKMQIRINTNRNNAIPLMNLAIAFMVQDVISNTEKLNSKTLIGLIMDFCLKFPIWKKT